MAAFERGRAPGTRRAAPRIFGLGVALWLACLITIEVTGNAALVPSLILLGSFVVPVTFVTWAFESWRDDDVTTELLVVAFVVGGLLGALGASVLEAYLLHPSPWLYVGVGLIEEGAKIVALLVVTRGMSRRHARDGMVLGAAVGFGFAAFESAGYAFQVLLSENGSLGAMVQTQVLRGLLAPVGHGLWTAILGGVVFARLNRRRGAVQLQRPRWSDAVSTGTVVVYLWVSLLHALWDSMRDIAGLVAFVLTATPMQRQAAAAGFTPELSPAQQELAGRIDVGGLVVVSVLGLACLVALIVRTRPGNRRRTAMAGEPRW